MKSLQIPNFPDPFSPTPIPSAFAVVAGFAIDNTANTGRVTLNVYRDATAASGGFPPIGQVGFELGADKGLPPLAQVIGDNQKAWDLIVAYLIGRIQALPGFTGSTQV